MLICTATVIAIKTLRTLAVFFLMLNRESNPQTLHVQDGCICCPNEACSFVESESIEKSVIFLDLGISLQFMQSLILAGLDPFVAGFFFNCGKAISCAMYHSTVKGAQPFTNHRHDKRMQTHLPLFLFTYVSVCLFLYEKGWGGTGEGVHTTFGQARHYVHASQ